MKKIHIFIAVVSLIASIGLAAPVGVSAQYYSSYGSSYVPTYDSQYNQGYATYGTVNTYGTNSTYGTCTNLTVDLRRGMFDSTTGGQVSALQSFLISQGYLTVTKATGYYGVLTYQAVAKYQYAHGIPSDGSVGALTRTSIQNISCGNNYGYNNYNYNNSGYNNYYTAPVLSSLSATSGVVGQSVTIYGSGFDLSNNTVNFGGTVMSGIVSYNGTSLTFTVPQVYSTNYNYNNNTIGAYSVYVTSTRGTSNALSFTITGNTNCYTNNYNYSNSYNNCYNNNYNNGSVSISNVTGPTTLNPGTQGTWSLSLYNPNTNYVSVSVKWGDENTYNNYGYVTQQTTQSSYVQGQQTITFTHVYQTAGNYNVVFTATSNQGAQTTASATVNVTGGSIYQNQPYLSSISPSSARVGTQVALYGSNFSSYGNTVHFGNGGTANLSALNSGALLYYTIPSYVSGCDITSGYGVACPMYAQQITPGTYPVYVSNSAGQTSTIYFTVTY